MDFGFCLSNQSGHSQQTEDLIICLDCQYSLLSLLWLPSIQESLLWHLVIFLCETIETKFPSMRTCIVVICVSSYRAEAGRETERWNRDDSRVIITLPHQ